MAEAPEKQSSRTLPFRLCLCKDLVSVVAGAGLGGGGQAASGGGDHGHGLGRVLRGISRGTLCEHCHWGAHTASGTALSPGTEQAARDSLP